MGVFLLKCIRHVIRISSNMTHRLRNMNWQKALKTTRCDFVDEFMDSRNASKSTHRSDGCRQKQSGYRQSPGTNDCLRSSPDQKVSPSRRIRKVNESYAVTDEEYGPEDNGINSAAVHAYIKSESSPNHHTTESFGSTIFDDGTFPDSINFPATNCIDRNMKQVLANLRRRLSRFLASAESASEREDCVPCPPREEVCEEHGPVTNSARRLNYSPRSKFLRNVKRRSDDATEASPNQCRCWDCTPDGDCRYRFKVPCRCCRCKGGDHLTLETSKLREEEENVPLPKAAARYKPYFREQLTPRGGEVCIDHDPCTCFGAYSAFRLGSTEASESPRGLSPGESAMIDSFEMNQSMSPNESVQKNVRRRVLDWPCSLDETIYPEFADDEANGDGHKRRRKRNNLQRTIRKSQHISRSPRRHRKSKTRPPDSKSQSPELEFEPSLKRPHPNSCERCWRYASPSRSPVNKPSQRFDPNFRRSHSEINLRSESGDRRSSSPESRRTDCIPDYRPETKARNPVTTYKEMSVPRAKSADNIKRVNATKPQQQSKNYVRSEDADVKPMSKKEEPDPCSTRDVRNKTPVTRSDGNQRAPVTEEKPKKTKALTQDKKSSVMQSSPSMFDKNSQKSSLKKKLSVSTRPSSGETSVSEKRKSSKRRPSSARQTNISNHLSPRSRARAHSFDRDRCISKELKENYILSEDLRPCCAAQSRREPLGFTPRSCPRGVPADYLSYRNCAFPPEMENWATPRTYGCEAHIEPSVLSNRCCSAGWAPRQFEGRNRFDDGFDCQHYVPFSDPACRPPDTSRGKGLGSSRFRNCPITLWSTHLNFKDGLIRDDAATPTKRGDQCEREKGKKRFGSLGCEPQNNPRKYCVFYMTKNKKNVDDDVEVLIEELTEGKSGKDVRSEVLKDKRKKFSQPGSDSMALRFQKGVCERTKRPENSRVLYI